MSGVTEFHSDGCRVTLTGAGRGHRSIILRRPSPESEVRELDRVLKENLRKDGLAVIFVETKSAVDGLELRLHEAGVKVAAIHSDRPQGNREDALNAFKTGENPILIATDTAARGLAIPNLSLVDIFVAPNQDPPDWFNDLVSQSRRGDTDLQMTELKQAVPQSSTAPAMAPGSWGQSGVDDAW